MHVPERHVVPVVQTRPQRPQLLLSEVVSTQTPEQLTCGAVQMTEAMHVPATQFWVERHARPHEPQFARSVERAASQPFVASSSQSPKPVLHASLHAPSLHCDVPLGPEGHAMGTFTVPSGEQT